MLPPLVGVGEASGRVWGLEPGYCMTGRARSKTARDWNETEGEGDEAQTERGGQTGIGMRRVRHASPSSPCQPPRCGAWQGSKVAGITNR
ncbi:hypothetical protein Cob_v003976 [Colletotrichum orbiculare MAFF 240422]|uniref:Uncharacterized protein n=1 Tax=Colletotrichum orbiculare (strain 104-T / ATCC 96160 / CBS 514.97 / LARS 414 / MAFF 240422) TaxID=1213857 RepID=A0A484FZ75_COLOR|nr:hypothetical protein Cob_v003976 [Colletotrichum orbiculare MAFF 240422]